MRPALLHIVLAVLWMLLWGAFDLYTLAAGLIVAYLLLALFEQVAGEGPGFTLKIWRVIPFLFYFVKILVVANLQVARLVLAPRMPIHPRIIRYDVGDLSPLQITTLANALTLTPGTLAADIGPDHRFLYIHCLNAPDAAQAVRDVDELRRRLLWGLFS